jgi:hypothetical protein
LKQVRQQYPVVFQDIPKYISGKAMTAIQLTGVVDQMGQLGIPIIDDYLSDE